LLSGLFNGLPEDIEDAQQEVLCALYTGMAGFRFQSSFRTFLYRVCRNTAIDMLRRKGRERRRVEASAREARALAGARGELVFDPDEEMARGDYTRAVREALSSLNPEERMMIVLKESEGMRVEEIAQALSIPAGTAKSRLHRIRNKLARRLRGRMA
jgi:RNA polymerase sigma-70 factor (ECF subfamily)